MKTSSESILTVKNLSAGYGSHTVLEDVSFELHKGEVLGIIGQNGSGKSTLLKAMSGLIPLKKGTIILNEKKKKNKIISHRLFENGISYFTQGGLIMPALTVEEHLSLVHSQTDNNTDFKEKVHEQFPKLFDLKDQRAGSLSGGERQMLSFGILIAQNTYTWLLDEPTAGLSPNMVHQTVEFLQEMKQKKRITVLLVEHNLEATLNLVSSLMIMKEGKLSTKFSKEQFETKNFIETFFFNPTKQKVKR